MDITNNFSNVSRINCYVCGELLNAGDECFSNKQTAIYSGTDVNELLEKMLGENLVNLRESEFRVWCSSCLKKIDSYDEAIITANQRQQELMELFYGRIGKFEIITLTPNVQGQIKEELIDIPKDNIAINKPEKSTEDDNIPLNEKKETTEDDNIPLNDPKESTKDDNIPLNEPEEDDYSVDNVDTNETANNNDVSKIKPKRKAKPQKKTVCTCDQCGQMFNKNYMNAHRKTHLPPEHRECKICGKKFTRINGLKRHMAIHTGEIQFQCDKCGRQFIHQSHYHQHKWTHENRICKCTICGKEMTNPNSLYKHMRMHKNKKSHTCPTCEKTFSRSENMREHIRVAHEGIHRNHRFKCHVCGKIFPRPSKMKEHIAKKHNAIVVTTQPSKLDASCEESSEFVLTPDT